jgi:exonuclease VII large subunit
MDKGRYLPGAKLDKNLASIVRLKTSCHEVLERELKESLNKLEHRAEILEAISHHQRTSECYELAEAYRKQAMISKACAQSIRRLLTNLT